MASKLDEFHDGWANGDKHAAIDARWLDATASWSEALLTTLNGLASRVDGDEWSAQQRFAESADLVRQAEAIQVPPGENNIDGRVKIGDGVLDEFLDEAPHLH